MNLDKVNNQIIDTGKDKYKEVDRKTPNSGKETPKFDSQAVVYDKTKPDEKGLRATESNSATIKRLMADSKKRAQQMRDLVESVLIKQGNTHVKAKDIYKMLREGNLDVDPTVQAQAQKDIAEDGYWGVEQTSERLVSFAMAVSGDDPEMADKMIDAVKKGFGQATKAWGSELPEISHKTLEATINKLENWRQSFN